jgi:hypothetical protein
MDVTRSQLNSLLQTLQAEFSQFTFAEGAQFSWSPSSHTIFYVKPPTTQLKPTMAAALFHELGHAVLDHQTYLYDIELIRLESAAWHKAKELAHIYGHTIDTNHIEDCLDTYRDWLYVRSACKTCLTTSMQPKPHRYLCYNCNATWVVEPLPRCAP